MVKGIEFDSYCRYGFDSHLSLMYWRRASDPRAAACSHVVIFVTFAANIITVIMVAIVLIAAIIVATNAITKVSPALP